MIDGAELLRFLAAFIVIGLALFALSQFSRNGSRMSAFLRRGRIIEVLETTPLPHGASLHVARIGEAHYALGRSEGGIAVLCEISPDVVARRGAAATPRAPTPLPSRAR